MPRCGAKVRTINWKERSSSSGRRPVKSRRWWEDAATKSRNSTAAFRPSASRGSVFKPFVFLAAFMHGGQSGTQYFSDTVVNDSLFTWAYDGGQSWQPHNYNNDYYGAVTVRRALESSLNSATARVAQDVGIRRVRDVARRLGIESSLPAVPSLSLGSAEVTPLEVAVAFSTLANGGVRARSVAVKHVMDQNTKVLEKRDVKVEQVLSPSLAYRMNQLLKGVMDHGTGASARRWGLTRRRRKNWHDQ